MPDAIHSHRGDINSFDQNAFISDLSAVMGRPVTFISAAPGSVMVTTGMDQTATRDAVAYANDGRLSQVGVESVAVQGQAPVSVGMRAAGAPFHCSHPRIRPLHYACLAPALPFLLHRTQGNVVLLPLLICSLIAPCDTTASTSSGLSAGAVAGIVVGVAAVLGTILAFGGVRLYKLEKERRLRRPLPIPEEFGPAAGQLKYAFMFRCCAGLVAFLGEASLPFLASPSLSLQPFSCA